ncbi:calcium-binding protein, partial [Schinkia azotoformans]|uniref:calcium-binding protein n=1 Tax=Schinkia azotoformans TaxID=1454 RepID=UPI002E1A5B42|nr:calcium-binding protein [Schinkia azotoformans]
METILMSVSTRPDISKAYSEAIENPDKRIEKVEDFFNRYTGESPTGNEANYGEDVKGFMQWEKESGRLGNSEQPGSEYWKKANGQMIHDMMMAEELIKQGKEDLATDAEKRWLDFINQPNQENLWEAHNYSINQASLNLMSDGTFEKEPPSERAFISSVLIRVNGSAWGGFPSYMGIIDELIADGPMNYADNYPAIWEQDKSIYPTWDFFPLENELYKMMFDKEYRPSIGKLKEAFIEDVSNLWSKGEALFDQFINALADEDIPGFILELLPKPNGQIIKDMGEILLDKLSERFDKSVIDKFKEWLNKFNESFSIHPPRIDPLIIDLDGDGIETRNVNGQTYFDLDRNGFAEQTGWVGSDDGLLVLDRNHDGIINNGGELFGDQTLLRNGQLAKSGFQALSDLDDNADGKIDSSDTEFNNIKIWRDQNGDGISSESELYSLNELGIKSLSTNFISTNIQDNEGNIQARKGAFERFDGTSGQMGDYLLERDLLNTRIVEELDVPGEIQSLPFLQGVGNVYNLHQAMVRDESGTLKGLVEQFMNSRTISESNLLFEQILFTWMGNANVDPSSRGANIDARKLVVLENVFAQSFFGVNGSNPNVNAATSLEEIYKMVYEYYYSEMSKQTYLKPYYEQMMVYLDSETNGIKYSLDSVQSSIQNLINENPTKGHFILSEFVRMLKGSSRIENVNFSDFRNSFVSQGEEFIWSVDSAGKELINGTIGNESLNGTNTDDAIAGNEGNDNLYGNNGSDILYGQSGVDRLYGGSGEDILLGGNDNDYLYGDSGNDVLNGGAGNDQLYGGYGNDVYLFGRWSGKDTIYEDYDTTVGNADIIRFAEDITPSDIIVKRNGDHLELRIKGTQDKLTVQYYFSSDYYKVEKIVFADGTVWDVAFIKAEVNKVTEENDVIRGYDGINNILQGLGGNDTLYGANGDDRLDGGSQDDKLYGGNGSDILWGGSGQDTLYGENGNDVLHGGEGNDSLYGSYGNDELDGGAGNDYLEGSYGNDVYLFGRNSGQDTISDYDSTSGNVDIIRIAEDVASSDVVVKRNGDHLELRIKGTPGKLTVQNYFSSDYYKVEKIEFADGTVWDAAFIKAEAIKATEENDVIRGYDDTNDLLNGLGGNDTLYGANGDDQLDGGIGDDKVYGGNGSDIIWGGTGQDTLYGEYGNDVLHGGEGNDSLYGSYGNDELDGGAGNDYLEGSYGNDVYLFGRNSGQDTVSDYDSTSGNIDIIRIAEDVASSDVMVKRNGDHLELRIKGTPDKLTVQNYFSSDHYKVEKIEFVDGTVWDAAFIKAEVIQATEENDVIRGYDDTNDLLNGLGGNDTLYGANGDDQLDG